MDVDRIEPGNNRTSMQGEEHPRFACLVCSLDKGHLRAGELQQWRGFLDFEAALHRPGPWIAGIDMPFGQARRFIETAGWPPSWAGYVDHVAAMSRQGFRDTNTVSEVMKHRPPDTVLGWIKQTLVNNQRPLRDLDRRN